MSAPDCVDCNNAIIHGTGVLLVCPRFSVLVNLIVLIVIENYML